MGAVSFKLLRSAFGAAPPRERAPRRVREAELLVLRGLTALLEAGRGGAGDRVPGKLAAALGRGVSLAHAYAGLDFEEKRLFETSLAPELLAEFFSLAEESDAASLREAMLGLALRLEAQGRIPAALALYRELSPAPTRGTPQERFEAILGGGTFGNRAERALRDLVGQATDYRAIVPMVAGSMAYAATRAAFLGRCARAMPGLPARAAATGAGFLAEVPVFALGSRGLHAWSGEAVAWDAPSVARDFGVAALALGAMKLGGSLGRRGLEGLAFGRPAFAERAGWLLPQAGMYFGLLAAHETEVALGLRGPAPWTSSALDAFASLLALGAGARLGQRALGPGFSRFQAELRLRAEGPARRDPWPRDRKGDAGLAEDAVSPDIPLLYRPVWKTAREAGAVQFLAQGWLQVLQGRLGPHFNPYLRVLRRPSQPDELVYAESDFEIHLQRDPQGALLTNGRREGGRTQRDRLYVVRGGDWAHPYEVRVLTPLTEGDFVLWRRKNGECEIRVFEKSGHPLRWEDFPRDRLKPPRLQQARVEASVETGGTTAPSEESEVVEAKPGPLDLPAPEIAEEEFWYEGAGPKALATIEVADLDIVSELSVETPSRAGLPIGAATHADPPARGSSLLDRDGVRGFFQLSPEEGMEALRRKILGLYPELGEAEREAVGRVVDLVFSEREEDLKIVREIRQGVRAALPAAGVAEKRMLWGPTLGELSRHLRVGLMPWFLIAEGERESLWVAALQSHFFPDEVLVHAGLKTNYTRSPAPDDQAMELFYGLPPSKIAAVLTLGEFRERIFPWPEPWMGPEADLTDIFRSIPQARSFALGGKTLIYRLEGSLRGTTEIFSFTRIHPSETEPPGTAASPPEQSGEAVGDSRLGRRRFQVEGPSFANSRDRGKYLEAILDFLEVQAIPAAAMKAGQAHDLPALLALAELEDPASPAVRRLRAQMYPTGQSVTPQQPQEAP